MQEDIKNKKNEQPEVDKRSVCKINIKEQENASDQILNSVDGIKSNIQTKNYDAYDLRFMSSLSEAVLAKAPSTSKKILYAVAITIFWLLIWASWAQIDEITRGSGKIIPSGKNQAIQNLEGGIVDQIFVKEGDEVKKDQILIRLDNKNFTSSYGESKLRLDELQAKFMRLDAEANDKEFDYDEARDANNSKAIRYELSLHNSNIDHLNEQIGILTEQIHQRQSELVELKNKISQTQNSYNLVLKEKAIMEPIFKKGLVSEVEYIQLQRRVNDLRGELDAAVLAVPRVESTIKEAKNKIEEAKLAFKNNAKKELNEVSAEIARINESQISLSDRVERTYVRSPVNGIVSKMMVHTVSGVIKPGENIAEIVPLEDKLVAEVKVKPADVAFLRPGLDTMVKFTAYDFSIYGGLKGKVKKMTEIEYKYRESKLEETWIIATEFNESGYITKMTQHINGRRNRTNIYEYYKKGRIKQSIENGEVFIYKYEYDKDGNLVETKDEKIKHKTFPITRQRIFDKNGREIHSRSFVGTPSYAGVEVAGDHSYIYDENGTLIEMRVNDNPQVSLKRSVTYLQNGEYAVVLKRAGLIMVSFFDKDGNELEYLSKSGTSSQRPMQIDTYLRYKDVKRDKYGNLTHRTSVNLKLKNDVVKEAGLHKKIENKYEYYE